MTHRFTYNKNKYNSSRKYNSHRNYSQQNDEYKSYKPQSKWIKKSKSNEKNYNKQYYRNKVWSYMERNNIALFPRPVYHRIPNFIGAEKAALQLLKLKCFMNAKVVKVNPDKPQQNVRYLCLKMNKRLLIPTPRLNNYGLLNEIILPKHVQNNNQTLQMAATRKGLQTFGRLLSLNDLLQWKTKIDICIVGSVAVDKTNGYRIGKGEGYADIEIAILNELGLIDKHTTFIATVHDCQVFESLDSKLFDMEDVVLDYIVTPTQIIKINKDDKKDKLPYKINWNKLSEQQLSNMPILKQLKNKKFPMQYKSHKVNRW